MSEENNEAGELDKAEEVLGVGMRGCHCIQTKKRSTSTVADQVFRLGFNHLEVEAQLHQADLMVVGGVRADRKR